MSDYDHVRKVVLHHADLLEKEKLVQRISRAKFNVCQLGPQNCNTNYYCTDESRQETRYLIDVLVAVDLVDIQ